MGVDDALGVGDVRRHAHELAADILDGGALLRELAARGVDVAALLLELLQGGADQRVVHHGGLLQELPDCRDLQISRVGNRRGVRQQ